MAAIDDTLATKIFDAIEVIRGYLPEVEAISAMVPGYGPELVGGEQFLGKLFELIVTLRAHETKVDAAAALRQQTEDAWRDALKGTE